MRNRIRKAQWMVVIVSAAFAVLAGATSKNNLSQIKSPSKTAINIEVAVRKNVTSTNSDPIQSPPNPLEKDDDNSMAFAVKKKKRTKPKKQRPTVARVNGSSTRSTSVGTSTSLRRIKREYKDAVDMGIAYDWVNQRLITRKTKRGKSPSQAIPSKIMCLGPITTNLRQWHFSFQGAGEGVYSKGVYHGQIVLPKDYPLSPPSVQMWTPSGRFIPGMDICLSASNYHPESWTPRWSIQGIVNALRIHMLSPPNEIGGMQSTHDEAVEYARLSLEWKQTWKDGGTRITVDHRMLIQEGILGNSDWEEESDSELIDELMKDIDDEEDGVDGYEALTIETEDFLTIEDDALDVHDSADEGTIRFTTRFNFSMSTVASFIQLICLYMIVLLFFNR